MELQPKNMAKTLFFFEIFMFCRDVSYTLVSDADPVCKTSEVSHFDCGAMTKNAFCALGQV